ncbi:U3 small nucleolar RNA-associated protein 6 domain-containing protein [Neurospora intermedia]|uniref:U3 small nucleolar RNA-associated protein 6 domain-containing protein n=1 Tax=Neurospora intermedia TaxID=5142 RepID=A0ABR3CXY8_NEUIN
MGSVAEKARFYLERAAPQLREFEEKEIFNKDEIRSLVTKRSDFEHLVLSPGTKPSDFLSYVQWERSMDRLRAKRCKRLKIRGSNPRPSEARVFGIFERAVMKHPGCIPLWIAYLDFAAEIKATKRWRRVITKAIRMHPRSAVLWTMAGRNAAVHGDMERARAYFLRGCRFCTGEVSLWVEYARCEMEWLARIEAKKSGKGVRRGVNPIEAIKATEGTEIEGDHIALDDSDEDDEVDGDELILPDPDAGEKKKKPIFDAEATRKLEQSPALSGAIPMAIFDIAKKQPFYAAAACEAFFDMFATFGHVSCQSKITQHVLSAMEESFPKSACTASCFIRQPLIGVDINTPEFPNALRESLARLRKAYAEQTEDKKALAGKIVDWASKILEIESLDPAIKTVLEATKKGLEAELGQEKA